MRHTFHSPTIGLVLAVLIVGLANAEDNLRERAAVIVSRIQRADYEGDRMTLKKCYDELSPLVDNQELRLRIRYWRGFARWRDGINAGNESVEASEMEKLFLAGVDEFKAA